MSSKSKKNIFKLSLLTYAVTMQFAYAEDREQTSEMLPTIELNADSYKPPYTAVEASSVLRDRAKLFETPQSISVVTHKKIEENQYKNVSDALEEVAGVSANPYGRRGWDDFIIRGQISSAQTYVDGLRVQTSTNVLRSEDLSGIDAIQVVKGPTSVGFGLALPGGLVNLTTKRPEAKTSYQTDLTYGSYGQKEGLIDLNYAPNDKKEGAFRLVGHISNQDDPTNYVYFKNRYVAGSYNFDLDSQNEWSIVASYQHRKYIRNQGIPQNYQDYGRNIFIGEPDRYYDVDVYRFGSNYTHYFENDWLFKQNFAVTKNRSWSNSAFAASNATFPVVKRQVNYQDKQDTNFALDQYFQKTFKFDGLEYEFTTGLDMMRERSDYYQRVDNVNSIDANNLSYGIKTTKQGTPSWNLSYNQYMGLYTKNNFKLNDKWIVGLSGRHDWTQVKVNNFITGAQTKNSDNAFTGSASLMYRLNDNLAPYLTYSTSFMPVTDSGQNGRLLNPEEGKQTEVGMKFQTQNEFLQGYVAYYDLTRKNVTETDAVAGYSIQTGEQRTKGYETELTAHLSDQWNMSTSYSYIPTAETTKSVTASDIGKRINHVPKHSASLSTKYYFEGDNQGWNIGGGIRFQGERTAQRGNYFVDMPSYTLFDVSTGYEAKNWGASLNIKNLFDKEYIQGTTPNAQLVTFGSPRTFSFNVKFKY